MTRPILSIVTVTRNAEELLSRTLSDIASRNHDDIEYIVVDGASTDSSVRLIAESSCVDKWISEPDRGIYDAMNKAVSMASGHYVLFMNAGDTFASPDTLSRLISTLRQSNDDVVYGHVIRAAHNGEPDRLMISSPVLKPHRLAFCHQSVATRLELLKKYPFDISHKFSADFKLYKQLQKDNATFSRIDFPVARFDTQGVSTRHRAKGLVDNMRVIFETDGLFNGLPAILHLLPTWLICKIREKM